MSNLIRRNGTISRTLGSYLAPGASYTVTAYEVGAQVVSVNTGTNTITVRAGHGFAVSDKFIVVSGGSMRSDSFRAVSGTPGTTTIVYSGDDIIDLSAGDYLVNLGPDTGTSTPNYTGSGTAIYTDVAGAGTPVGTAQHTAQWSTVTSSSTGEYGYYTYSNRVWELVRTSAGTVVDLVVDATQNGGMVLYASDYATSGNGTVSSPWVGWESCIQKVVDAQGSRAEVLPHIRLHFPSGIYSTTTSGVFSDITSDSSISGLCVTGDGWWNSIIRFGTLTSDTWFFDNYTGSTHENSWKFATFTDLAFQGAIPTGADDTGISDYAKGFRIYSDSQEQGYVFTRCEFTMLHTGFQLLGTNTASEMKFIGCKFRKIKDIPYYINNIQSTNHEFVSTDFEQIYGTTFKIGSSGGGSIKVYGGSFIPFDITGASTMTYVLDMAGSTGGGGLPIIFNGIRFELRHAYTGLVKIGSLIIGDVHFVDCDITDGSATADKTVCTISGYGLVLFDRCNWYDVTASTYKLNLAHSYTSNAVGQPGHYVFEKCRIPSDFYDRFSIGTSGVGRVTVNNCFPMSTGSGLDRAAINFTINNRSNGTTDRQTFRHRALLIGTGDGLPYYNGSAYVNQREILLPKNCRIMSIFLHKPATSGGSSVYKMYVGTQDEGTVYASSISSTQAAAHTINVEDLNVDTGTATNTRTVRVWVASTGTGDVETGGYAWVEYI